MAVIRKSRGLTQAQLAELVDIESETVSRFETGNSIPSLRRLCEIAEALNVDLASMLIDANVAADPKLRIAALLEDLQPADADLLVQLVHTLSRRLVK